MRRLTIKLLLLILILTLFPVAPQVARAAMVVKAPSALGLVGYWSMNEKQGNVTNDLSGNGYMGTLNGPSVPAWIAGKQGGSLSFSGTPGCSGTCASYGVVTTNSFSLPTSLSVCAWVYPKFNEVKEIILHGNSPVTAFELYQSGTSVALRGGSATAVSAPAALNLNAWNFVCGIISSTTGQIFVNNVGYTPGTVTAPITTSAPLNIGAYANGGYGFNGYIDEVRVYSRALSAAEISRLYTSTQLTQKAPTASGLIGYWPLDEGRGNKVMDYSSNGAASTFSGSPVWTAGKSGKSLNFNGSSDYLTINSSALNKNFNAISVSLWMNATALTSSGEGLASADTLGYGMTYFTDGYVWAYIGGGGNSVRAAVAPGGWHLVTEVFDGVNLSLYVDGVQKVTRVSGQSSTGVPSSFKIGYWSGYFNGKLDDVRVYNRALSAGEIQKLYNSTSLRLGANQSSQLRNGLVGYWSFNGQDVSGTTAYDRSGQGNNGTIASAVKLTGGKVGQGLVFNGSSGDVNMGDNSTFYLTHVGAVSMWVNMNPQTYTNFYTLFNKGDWGGCRNGYRIYHQANDSETYYRMELSNASTCKNVGISFSSGTWHFLTLVWDGTNIIGYLDGKQYGITTQTFDVTNNGTGITIGSPNTPNGIIDEVRVYNRALSAQEVQLLYNLGK